MKNKMLYMVIVLIVLLLIPINIDHLKDGGSKIYTGLIYNVTKVHRINVDGYEDGLIIELFGKEIYNKTNKINNINIGKLEGPITIMLKSGTLTNNNATFIITNNSNLTYTYGPEYYLEKEDNGVFNEIKLDNPLTWNAIINTLNPGEKSEINIDFTIGYGSLSNGKYRLVKKVYNDGLTMYINAEFIINDKK